MRTGTLWSPTTRHAHLLAAAVTEAHHPPPRVAVELEQNTDLSVEIGSGLPGRALGVRPPFNKYFDDLPCGVVGRPL